MICPMREEHFDSVFLLLKEFVANTRYGSYAPLEDDFAVGFYTALDDGMSYVALDDGEVVGMLLATKTAFWFNRNAPSSMELAWWVSPEHRASTGYGDKLRRAYEDSARQAGVKYIGLATMDNSGIDKYLEKSGYVKREQAWIKEIV